MSNRTHTIGRAPVVRSAMLVLSLLAALIVAEPPAAAAQSANFSTTATLGDGVYGLDPNRNTTVEAEVWAIESVGPYMLVGGAFLGIRDRTNSSQIPRPYLAAFDPSTGEYVPWWGTQPDGPVYDIVDLGNGKALIAGEFSSVNGLSGTERMAVIDATTGLVDTNYSFKFDTRANSQIRAVALSGNDVYFTGGFNEMTIGGVGASASGLGKFSLATGRLDAGWTPTLKGGGGWGIAVGGNRVVVGGYFTSVNGVDGTETLAALDPSTGALVNGWNHGYPDAPCVDSYPETCGIVNGLAIHSGRVFVAGAKHFWSALDLSDGKILVTKEVTNDAQSVDVIGDYVIIGCHCETKVTSVDFNGIPHRYARVIDPKTLNEIESPTVNSRGAAGVWASALAPDGCAWVGGNFSSTLDGEKRSAAWSMLRFCPPGGPGSNPALPQRDGNDTSAPATPGRPIIASVNGSTVTLRWPTVADNSGQRSYLIFRNGKLVGRGSATTFEDKLLPYKSTYEWQIMAIDMAGNVSEVSARSVPVRIGAAVNVAPSGTATQVSDYDSSTPASRAIDGRISNNPDNQLPSRTGSLPAGNEAWFNLDLGREIHVDRVVLHPRRDALYRESNDRTRMFSDTRPITGTTRGAARSGGHSFWQGNAVRSPSQPRIDTIDLNQRVRYMRFFIATTRLSFDEVQVFTTYPQATPSPRPADVTKPTGPKWQRVVTRNGVSVLEWGGASDNVALARFVITQNGEFVGTSTESRIIVPAGATAGQFEIVAIDAAGNASGKVAPPPTPPTPTSDAVDACVATVSDQTIKVTWSGGDGASRFIVRRSVNDSRSFWRGSVNAPASSFDDTNRDGDLVYTVEARHGATATTPTECTSATETAPTGLRFTRAEPRRIVVNWQGNDRMVEIERDGVIVGSDDDDWFTDRDLEPGTTYTYRVRFEGTSSWSQPITVKTEGTASLAAPESCSWKRVNGPVELTWPEVDGATEYIVQRRVDDGPWWWRGRTSDTTFGENYRSGLTYRVKARHPGGDSAYTVCAGP